MYVDKDSAALSNDWRKVVVCLGRSLVEINTRTEQQLWQEKLERNSTGLVMTSSNKRTGGRYVGVDLLCLHKQQGRSSKWDGTQSRHSFVNQVSSRRTTYTPPPHCQMPNPNWFASTKLGCWSTWNQTFGIVGINRTDHFVRRCEERGR